MSEDRLPAPELAPGRPNLILAGFSATGKTSAGAQAAERLALPFLDLDQVAARRLGLALPDAFRTLGEAKFREVEAELLREARRLSGTVIAVGGGAVLQPDLVPLGEHAVRLVLTATPDELERRLGDASSRPLLADVPGQRIRELLTERGPAYAAFGPSLETTGKTVVEVAGLIADRYLAQADDKTRTLTVPGPQGAYPVFVGENRIRHIVELLALQLARVSRVVVISDQAVAGSAGAQVAKQLRAGGSDVVLLSVGSGEQSKRLPAVTELWDRFGELAIDRGDVIVAVGGGASLDTVGFAAATWLRGIPWITIPTTILAMVDAAIGGKVAIDRAGAKNSVGAFHHPQAVIADPTVLATLAPRVARDGLAEVVKSAVLASPLMLAAMAEADQDGPSLPDHLDWMIEQAVRIKAAYVGADPDDQGVRQSLNLGHTYAHGLEAASDYAISHGRAVAVGLLAAATLGARLGLDPAELPSQLTQVLSAIGLLEPLPWLDRDRVRSALLLDKKRRAGVPGFVVPAPGGAVLVTGLDPEEALDPLWEVLGDSETWRGHSEGTPTGVAGMSL
ncbi:MAG: bifunctional shikimate kinase/3-dehydroquinate synthase [Candidatus Dormiibacterota bacterium]